MITASGEMILATEKEKIAATWLTLKWYGEKGCTSNRIGEVVKRIQAHTLDAPDIAEAFAQARGE